MSCPGRGGGWGTLDFKWQGWWKDFFEGVRFSISGFFWVGKFWQVFFWVFKTNVSIFRVISFFVLCFLEISMTGDLHGIFWGLNFSQGIFLGFVWSLRDFFGFWFLPPFDHPCHSKFGVPTWGALSHKFKCSVLWATQNRIPLYLMPLLRWRT